MIPGLWQAQNQGMHHCWRECWYVNDTELVSLVKSKPNAPLWGQCHWYLVTEVACKSASWKTFPPHFKIAQNAPQSAIHPRASRGLTLPLDPGWSEGVGAPRPHCSAKVLGQPKKVPPTSHPVYAPATCAAVRISTSLHGLNIHTNKVPSQVVTKMGTIQKKTSASKWRWRP